MLVFLEDLFRFHGSSMHEHADGLTSVPHQGEPIPHWFAWADYIGLIARLGELYGEDGIARAMRGAPRSAYAEFRAAKGFFPSPDEFFVFYTHNIMPSTTPGIVGVAHIDGDRRVRLRYDCHPSVRVPACFHAGSLTLIELFPTHFDLPEATVKELGRSDYHLEVVADFPQCDPKDPWAGYLRPPASSTSLTPRERQVLTLVTRGFTNREVAQALGTAPSTVRNQLSAIMAKMNAANRTELAGRARAGDLDDVL